MSEHYTSTVNLLDACTYISTSLQIRSGGLFIANFNIQPAIYTCKFHKTVGAPSVPLIGRGLILNFTRLMMETCPQRFTLNVTGT